MEMRKFSLVQTTCNDEENKSEERIFCQTLRRNGCGGWCRKFFWQGQIPNQTQVEELKNLSDDLPLHRKLLLKYRRLIAFAIPALIVHFLWWATFIKWNMWHLFETGYPMSITMIGGSIIAGMTSEGGGSVAFPVMTLVLNVNPTIARDFSLMIQSFGMTCAAFSIIFMQIQLEWYSIIFCSIGGIFGMIFGFHVVDAAMTGPQKKMYFVSIWFAFAFALFLLNWNYKRTTFKTIPNMNWWRIEVLVCTGFVGGICSAFSGNGLDVSSFCVLTLLFRVTEKVATPTSVVLMAIGTTFGFFWREVIMDKGPDMLAWDYLAVCIPVVVLGAPFGAVLGSHFHRLVLAAWVYASDLVALLGGFILVKQTPMLAGVSAGLIIVGFGFFIGITFIGRKLNEGVAEESEQQVDHVDQAKEAVSVVEVTPDNTDL
ncbi:uncharacterized protein LOC135498055 [Lineus longissimus]|uniref:uncharacterized protein LOC135498055 n=1 Tax=Lineus longissimus TaxID=88925 RepID=UPI002B4D0154